MIKESFLYAIIGVFLGLILGFMLANSFSKSTMLMPVTAGVQQNPNLPEGHPNVGGNSRLPGQQEEITPDIQAAIDKAKQEPKNFESQTKAAELTYDIQRLNEAIEFLKRANELKPDDYQTIVNLGNAYFDAEQFVEAEKWYLAALAKKPDDVNARTDLGLTFIFRQPPNYDRAIQEFQRSLETNPNHPQTLQNLTVAYTKKGDAVKAKLALSRLENLDASNSVIPKLREEIQKLDNS
jgi:tetratricopeptide (TPR) repeat protein